MKGFNNKRVVSRAMMAAGLCTVVAWTGACSAEMKTDDQKVSYSFGLKVGEDLGRFFKEVDIKSFTQGFEDGVRGNKPRIEEKEMMTLIQSFQTRKMEEQRKVASKQGDENKAKGEKFLAENGKRAGVTTLPDGLQYEVLKSGNGATPGPKDEVKVHYHGTLVDGTVFDSSVQRGEPATFPVDGVIPGWTEVLQKMKVGDKWKVAIPSSLAYGERAMGNAIGPNETLVFEVELLDVKPAAANP